MTTDPPPPVEFPPGFTTELSRKGLQKGLMRIRDSVSETAFEPFLKFTGGVPTPNELVGLEGAARNKKIEAKKVNWYRVRKLENVREKRAELLGYDARALWIKRGSSIAYDALLDMIHVCGGTKDYFEWLGIDGPNAALRLVAWEISRLTRCDLWTLYGWDHGRCRPLLVDHSNLWYPEAVIGASWLGGPVRQYLLRDEVEPAIADCTGARGDSGGFTSREYIDRSRSKCVILRTSRLRAVLFLNWREPDAEEIRPDRASRAAVGFVEPPPTRWHEATGHPLLEEAPCICLDEMTRDLRPALMHATAWLAARDETISALEFSAPREHLRALVRTIADSFKPWLPDNRADLPEAVTPPEKKPGRQCPPVGGLDALRTALDSLLPAGLTTAVYSCDPSGQHLILKGLKLATHDGHKITSSHVQFKEDGEAWIRLEPESDGLMPAQTSLLAQSIVWKASLLLPEIEERSIPDGDEAGRSADGRRRSLLDIRLRRYKDMNSRFDAAVPIYAGDSRLGGISVESGDEPISVEHIRWMEIFSFIVGAFYVICDDGTPDAARQFVGLLLRHTQPPRDIESLMYHFSRWIRDYVGADVALVVTNDETGRFVPSGVSASGDLTDQICRPPDPPYKKEPVSINDKPDWIRGRLLVKYLHPRPHGKTWDVFRTGERIDATDPRSDVAFGDVVRAHFRTAAVLPFQCHAELAPLGVIWILFGDPATISAEQFKAIEAVSYLVCSLYCAYCET